MKNSRKPSDFFARVLAAALVLLLVLCGCQKTPEGIPDPTTQPGTETVPASVETTVYRDGVIGARPERPERPEEAGGYTSDRKGLAAPDTMAAAVEAPFYPEMSYTTDGYWGSDNGVQPGAGTLTAGEWRDIENLSEWLDRFSDSEWARILNERALPSCQILKVHVGDAGTPVWNQTVILKDAQGNRICAAKTDIWGNAYLFYGKNAIGSSLVAAVDQEEKIFKASGNDTLSFEASGSAQVQALDLMLMIDTTGSMGDELEYIKAELLDMVERIKASGSALSVRVSVNFYRDEGDEYVVKYFDFRTDIQECLDQIRDQHATGGGDTPEAVHTALENAVNGHSWREDAVKLCFFVLDAPPHSEAEIQGINGKMTASLTDAARLGIRIIPVAASGVDTETEVILRSFAVMTGGTYIFLTNDSGIGLDHKPAEVGEFNVEPLNECMIRVACEYCGLTVREGTETPQPAEESTEESSEEETVESSEEETAESSEEETAESSEEETAESSEEETPENTKEETRESSEEETAENTEIETEENTENENP